MFNNSTRKEDLSLKLRSQNLRNAKQQTKMLEAESRKMEDRLQELKLAMNREKEMRQAGGGGFWGSGQEGNLGNYAQDVLNKPKKSSSASSNSSNREKPGSSKKNRVKVLKDEPIVVPDRKKAPGTMANIAQRNLVPNKEKIKGPRCGQCEQKAANVSCQECGEDYCAGCFAAFHLKGALKKHRSVPVGSIGMMRPNMTPRSAASEKSNTNSARSVTEQRIVDNNQQNSYMANGRQSPAGSHQNGHQNSLLDGDYDERANADEFAAALAEWRMGKKAAAQQPAASPPLRQNQPRVMAPRPAQRHQPTSSDSGTSTQEEKAPPIEIKFKSSLTYADRLLLKKHRRTDLGMSAVTTQPLTEGAMTGRASREPQEEHVSFDEVYGLITPRGGAMDPFSESAHIKPELNNFYHTAEQLQEEEEAERSESRLSIIMVDNVPAHRLRKYEQSSNYEVTDGPDDTMFNIEQSRMSVSPDAGNARYAFATPPTSGRPSPSGRRSTSARRSYTISPISAALKQSKENLPDDFDMTVISQNVLLRKGDVSIQQTPPSSAKGRKMPRAKSAAKERPASRTKSRTGSRAENRPGSRAKSRTYMYGEGLLTKGPSESLKEIARLGGQVAAAQYEKAGDLADFFTVGVKPVQPKDRVMTPSGQRKKEKQPEAGIEKWRVSNKLYAMGPRSWRPDSSLGNNVDETQVVNYLEDPSVAALEKMTNDIVNDMLTPRDPAMAQDTIMSRDREESTLSWSWSQQFADKAPTGDKADRLNDRAAYRERSDMMSQDALYSERGPSRSNTQYSMSDEATARTRPMSRTSRERSQFMKEKRDKAFQQSEDLFPTSPTPIVAGLRVQPVGASGSRPGTPRNTASRPNSRGTTRPDSGRPGSRTPLTKGYSSLYSNPLTARGIEDGRFTPSRPQSSSGRESRAIVVDGDDLSRFDELQGLQTQDRDDDEALGQLEWELASQEGRVTADGQISRMSIIDPDADIDIPEDTSPGRGLDSPPPEHNTEMLERQIRESVLMDDFTEMEDQIMADEVKALH